MSNKMVSLLFLYQYLSEKIPSTSVIHCYAFSRVMMNILKKKMLIHTNGIFPFDCFWPV